MEIRFQTLLAIYDAVQSLSNPTSYPISPGEILIRQSMPWDQILLNIEELKKENLVDIKPLGNSIAIIIKESGIRKAEALRMPPSS